MDNIAIKLYHSEEIRKLNISKKTNFKDFTDKICEFFNHQEITEEFIKRCTFKYTDEDGDIITFSSEDEWKNLLETFNGKSILKITLELKKSSIWM